METIIFFLTFFFWCGFQFEIILVLPIDCLKDVDIPIFSAPADVGILLASGNHPLAE